MDYIKTLTREQFNELAKPKLLTLCREVDPNPFDEPFIKKEIQRLILFEFFPSDSVIQKALVSGISSLGEESFFVSVHGHTTNSNADYPYHFEVGLAELKNYEQVIGPVEHTIYSINGSWAVINSLEEHSLLTGPLPFIGQMEKFIPDLNQQVDRFLEYYNTHKGNENLSDTRWMNRLLKHVYGKSKANLLLVKHGF